MDEEQNKKSMSQKNNKPIKVLMAINSLVVGGAERVFVNQVNYFDKNKFDVWVMNTVAEKGKTFRDELNLPAEKIIQFHFNKVFNIKELVKVHKFFKEQKFDVVITSLYLTNFVGRLIAKINKVPVICSYEQNIYPNKTKLQILADRWLARFTDVIFAVSQMVLDFTSKQEGISKSKFKINYNSTPLQTNELSESEKSNYKKELRIPQNATVVTNAGSLVEQKGQTYLIQAAKGVINKNQNVVFLISGQGKLKNQLQKEINDLGLSAKVILAGVQPINKVLSITDIFVMPSLWEGLSLVMLEAMSYGKPLVVTDISGVQDVITDGQEGLIVPIKNSQILAEKINLLISDSALKQKLSQNSSVRVQEFSIDKNVKIIENTILDIFQTKNSKNI